MSSKDASLLFTFIFLLNTHAHPATNRINIDKLRHLNDASLNYIKNHIKHGRTEDKTSDEYKLPRRCCVEHEGRTKSQENNFQGNKNC